MPVSTTEQAVARIACRNCGAELVVERGLMTADCPYCASPSVVERPAAPDLPRPRFAIGFGVEEERATHLAKTWLASRGPFAHGGLKRAALDRARGIYLPAYLYSATAEADYEAEIGEDYDEVETYTTTDSKGNTTTHTRTVTRTEWRELSGEWSAYVADVLVTASRGLANEELEEIEPFDLRALRRFGPELVSGWIAEEPSLGRDACIETARAEAIARIGGELASFLPGDSHRELRYDARVRDESAELCLVPVWVFAARYAEDAPPLRVLVNGQTGEAAGRVPLSGWRIALAVLLALAVIAAVVLVAVSS